MSTHSGIQLILIGLFLLGGFAAVLTALLQTMQNSGMVLFALLILTAVVMLCGMVWFLLGHVREMNKTILALLMTYLLVVLFVTLLSRQGQHNTSVIMELELFRALKMQDTDVLRHLLQNVALFVPLGVLLPLLHRSLRSVWWALLGGAALSTMIETTQLVLAVGQCDVNDILTNTLGAVLGYGVFWLFGRRME